MIVRIPVTKTYEVQLGATNSTDPRSARSVKCRAQGLSPEQIERDGNLVNVETGEAQVIGPAYPLDIPCTD